MYKQTFAVALLVLPVHCALAGDKDAMPIGEQTRLWLEIQKSPDFTDPAPPEQEGEVATRVYQRYLRSFEHDIPERMTQESVKGNN